MIGKIIGYQDFRDKTTGILRGYTLHYIVPLEKDGSGYRAYSAYINSRLLDKLGFVLAVNKEVDIDVMRTEKGSYRVTFICDSE